MSDSPVWVPRPDPALTRQPRPGLHPHRHTPNHLHGWVFLQHQVWVDYWGNEHEIELMPGDYVANVIDFSQASAVTIFLIVAATLVLRIPVRRAGPDLDCAAELLDPSLPTGESRIGDETPLGGWLERTPLLQALRRRAQVVERDG